MIFSKKSTQPAFDSKLSSPLKVTVPVKSKLPSHSKATAIASSRLPLSSRATASVSSKMSSSSRTTAAGSSRLPAPSKAAPFIKALPPYESPRDYRIPGHFDTRKFVPYKGVLYAKEAKNLAKDWREFALSEDCDHVEISLCTAYSSRTQPHTGKDVQTGEKTHSVYYFQVTVAEEYKSWWPTMNKLVTDEIKRHFPADARKYERFRHPLIRYTIAD